MRPAWVLQLNSVSGERREERKRGERGGIRRRGGEEEGRARGQGSGHNIGFRPCSASPQLPCAGLFRRLQSLQRLWCAAPVSCVKGTPGKHQRPRCPAGCLLRDRLLTHKAVRALHVQLHVALLREAHDTVVTPVGPLASVLLHVHLQRALLVEGFLTQRAVERTLPCVRKAGRGQGQGQGHSQDCTHSTHCPQSTHAHC